MSQAIANGTGGSTYVYEQNHALEFVVAGFVTEVAEGDRAGGFSDEVHGQSGSGASEHTNDWVQLVTTALKI